MEKEDVIQKFLEVFGRREDELFPGEKELLLAIEEEYQRDKKAFQIKREECALIVVDMQNAFVAPWGKIWIPEALRQVPRIKRLIEVCRELGVPVIYAAHTIDDDIKHTYYEYSPHLKDGTLREDSEQVKIYEELAPKKEERVIWTKHTYSAFAGSDLDYILRAYGTKTAIICGTATSICCESTARDAYFLYYNVVFGSDINSCSNWMAQLATLRTMRWKFARVMSGEEIIRILRQGEPA